MAKEDMILNELRRPPKGKDINISPLTFTRKVIEVTLPQVTDTKTWDMQVLGTFALQTCPRLFETMLWLSHNFKLQQ